MCKGQIAATAHPQRRQRQQQRRVGVGQPLHQRHVVGQVQDLDGLRGRQRRRQPSKRVAAQPQRGDARQARNRRQRRQLALRAGREAVSISCIRFSGSAPGHAVVRDEVGIDPRMRGDIAPRRKGDWLQTRHDVCAHVIITRDSTRWSRAGREPSASASRLEPRLL